MSTANEIPAAPSQAPRQALLAAGFYEEAGRLRRGPLAARLQRDWLIFQVVEGPSTRHLGLLSLGYPGLWKPASPDEYLFELPASLITTAEGELADEDEPARSRRAASQLADWAAATLDAAAPTDWHAPDEALVRTWLASQALTIQQGPLVRQIDLVCQPRRLALRSVLVPEVSASLSAARRAWIEKTLSAAQAQWRMTRLGFGGVVGKPTIEAEIDLTACPLALVGQLSLAAREALEAVSRHLLPTLSVLCDPTVCCETWETLF
jgi:hypothetical protein